ncbi:hypothetical protein BDM02DRAFT_3185068 [Thelephora ganbajun]|uniref:Uncharacterized protein n=1 Tax=Thelephora ganbajun TaxID=370292 RepID=A0ACB6ZMU7_THEGA|nr:hypothetical protein BDM02DRAFT_3185068 [Thelephora ganbajun]
MRPAEFCEYHIMASFSLIFLSNSTLALLLGIPYSEQRSKGVLDLNQPIFGQGEVVQIITSSTTVVLVFCLFLCGTRVVPCCRFRVSNVIAFIILAALSMLGACFLTAYGGRNEHCGSDGSQNPKCYRRPDVDLPLTWFSTTVALTGVVVSFILHLYDGAVHAWPQEGGDGPRPIRRNSLELVKMQKSSSGNGSDEHQEEAPACCSYPPYESSAIPLSSYVLPSIPLRKREMNKLGLTVITNVPMYAPFEFRLLEIETEEQWGGRGRDV